MFPLEFIQIFFYPSQQEGIHLFRNRENGEGTMIALEIANLLGYHSLSEILVRDSKTVDRIHYVLLQGEELKEFKLYLQGMQIFRYQKATRLLLITETGISFLLSKHCKEERIRIGEWLLYQILPKLRDYQSCLYYQKISSLYLQESLYLFIYQGRMGMLDFQLSHILGLPPIDYVVYGCDGYVENVHIALFDNRLYQILLQEIPGFPSLQSIYFFYESGIYRLLHKNSGAVASLLQRALEREIFPLFRQLGTHWIGIKQEEIALFEQSQENIPVLSTVMAESKQDWDILSERQRILESLEKIQEKLIQFENKNSLLWQESKQHREEMDILQKDLKDQQQSLLIALEKLEERIAHWIPEGKESPHREEKKVFDSTSTSISKEIALELGIYYKDGITPHGIFVKALIEYAQSVETKYLENFLKEKLYVKPGENRVFLKDIDYHIWKR